MANYKPIPVKLTAENKCDDCTGSICCTYVTQQIPGPRSKHDFDHLLWQLSHGGIQLYKDGDGWFLLIQNACLHLQADGRCGIYQDRPQICREYKNDFCEYDMPAREGWDLYFEDYASLLAYCRRRFKRWDDWKASLNSG